MKNIAVTDGNGNFYEKTYPKRAEGLIKHGRARRVDEYTICLARPPIEKLEDATMDPIINSEAKPEARPANPIKDRVPDAAYIMEKIEQIMADTAHIYSAIQAIGDMPVNNSINGGFGDQAKGEALGNIVASRETTNQRLIGLLEKMYEDIRPVRVSDNA